ncbi:hypothetical protein [Paenibacillus segetis]|nr:hypothetical protein [Paenibacillus segetis]
MEEEVTTITQSGITVLRSIIISLFFDHGLMGIADLFDPQEG